ncbi:MAG: o-succinylbenzoate synthase [Candidatus Sericytochromatia bacterium]|nr:o-succinylbenzoate synthase [Candidatus Sericytochromatia bacterium]
MPIAYGRYQLPYHQPVQLKQGLFNCREGLVLARQSPVGTLYAEVAPFPGLSRESLNDCLTWLEAPDADKPAEPPPALAWGLSLLQQTLPPVSLGQRLPLNALLTPQAPAALLTQARRLYAEGYRCFKLKVGFGGPRDDLRLIDTLLAALPGIALRLDANRCWSLAQALDFAARLPETGIDYLEEPLREPAQARHWREHSPQRLALDESLAQSDWQALAAVADVLVLKPMLLGPQRFEACVALARAQGQQLVISSVFESGLGLRALARLAYSLAPEVPAGLDTWRAFARDLTDPPFEAQAGSVIFSANMFTEAPDLWLKWVHSI